jgi:hypothetical protein
MEDNKINLVMKSLFRYCEFTKSKFPVTKILEDEKKILKERFNSLNEEEILFVVLNFVKYKESKDLELAMSDELLSRDFKNFLKSLN